MKRIWGFAAAFAAAAVPASAQVSDRIDNLSATILNLGTVQISGQTASAGQSGGAVNNAGTLIIGDNSLFSNNSAPYTVSGTGSGGALNNTAAGSVTVGNNAQFTSNTAAETGGAIANAGTMSIGNGALFNSNVSSHLYGGIANSGTMTVGDNAVFTNNGTTQAGAIGGAVLNQNSATFTVGNNALFQGNYSNAQGGALYQQVQSGNNTATLNVGDNARFISNTGSSAGAIYNLNDGNEDAVINIGANALFQNNGATSANTGALANYWGTVNIGDGVVFASNYSTSGYAGAVMNEGGVINFNGAATFQNNASAVFGGAAVNSDIIWNGDYSSIFFNGKTIFENNATLGFGGALANYDITTNQQVEVTFLTDAIFKNNTAGTQGGSIYNNGVINFNGGCVSFSSNTDNSGANDIYNDGTINFASGVAVKFDGGVNGNGVLNFAGGGTVSARLTGAANINASSIDFGSGTAIGRLTVAQGVEGPAVPLFSGAASGTLTFDPAAQTNALYSVTMNGDYTFNVQKADRAQFMASTGATGNQAAAVLGIMDGGASSNSVFHAVYQEMYEQLQSDNPAEVSAAVQSASAMAPAAAPAASSTSAQNALHVFNAAGSRFAGGGPATGMSSGDVIFDGSALWVQGMYEGSKLSGPNGFHSNSAGFSAGFEINPENWVAGLGYAYVHSNIKPDFRKTVVNSHTPFIYAQYQPSLWSVSLIAAYALGLYDETKYLSSSTLTADYRVNSASMQVLGGYDWEITDGQIITPQAGARYMNINARSYSDSAGNGVAAVNSNALTGVLGFKAENFLSGILDEKYTAFINAALTYDFKQADNSSVMLLANGSSVSVEGTSLERLGAEAGIGVDADLTDNINLAVEYKGAFRRYYYDNAGRITLKYKF